MEADVLRCQLNSHKSGNHIKLKLRIGQRLTKGSAMISGSFDAEKVANQCKQSNVEADVLRCQLKHTRVASILSKNQTKLHKEGQRLKKGSAMLSGSLTQKRSSCAQISASNAIWKRMC